MTIKRTGSVFDGGVGECRMADSLREKKNLHQQRVSLVRAALGCAGGMVAVIMNGRRLRSCLVRNRMHQHGTQLKRSRQQGDQKKMIEEEDGGWGDGGDDDDGDVCLVCDEGGDNWCW